MQLAGRLRSTTLGDLLGALHRSGATGTLELAEVGGRAHRVYLAGGLVTAVSLDRASASLGDLLRRENEIDEGLLRRSLLRALASRRLHGEVLVRDFHLSPDVVDRALRRQMMLRLSALEGLPDAQIRFLVTAPRPREALVDAPLGKDEFLAGRKRARDAEGAPEPPRSSRPHAVASGWDPQRATAYRTLGLPFGAEGDDVKRAYRRLVRATHPDLHPDATHEEKRALSQRFAEVAAAYRSLSA